MQSNKWLWSGLLAAALAAGCANDESRTPAHPKDLGDASKGEVLVPYEPVISHKITQDPSQFQMPTAPAPAEAAATSPAEAEGGETAAAPASAGDEYVTLAKQVVDNLTTGQYAKVVAALDANLQAQLPEAQLQAVWEQLVTQAGPFQEQGEVRREQMQGMEVAIVPIKMEKGTLEAKVVFGPEKTVVGLTMQPVGAPAPAAAPDAAPAAPAAPEDGPTQPPMESVRPAQRESGSGSANMDLLPPTAPPPVGGLN